MNKARGLALWRILRISTYVNSVLIVTLFAMAQNYVVLPEVGNHVFIVALIGSHLNYHYQLARVARFLGKNSNWWFASFITFPLGPLISYHFIKPVAIRNGLSV